METLLEAFSVYQRAQNLADTTIRNRESIVRSFGRRVATPLLEVGTRELRQYIGRSGVTAGTRRTERGALIAFYACMVADGYLHSNPAEGLPVVRVPKGQPRPFSAEQVAVMLESGAYRRTRAMIMLGYHQGFRVSQIARVRGDDIDLAERTFSTVSKGGKPGLLPLHPEVAELALDMPRTGWWFPARDGSDRPIRGSSVTDLITKAIRRSGITDPRLTPHSLRHGFGSGLVEQGVDIRVVQELMLHEDLSTTQIYTQVSRKRKHEGIQALPSVRPPARSGRRIAA
ncbi:hypothetical protein BMH32_04730 [Leucobacter sp. OLJS4]|uniref:tyrosine-type recombinase/integrase n=1 Tax=unclassified Leucobacter TaxID=2621730 RepID=UPI000C433818|nr:MULTISPECIES: tyrosine-type recombinase/integrase [unclassified Leucobacter]PII81554.1 hypothetical protein BMH25_13590 [Leucobacter sp. OLCALW19]PII86226.1 hypothetical protein BMH26_14010 [Leucobacter sp. OLTLW20]PII90121.1 hypothetical protein BMH27_12175 [Leucobacter sp. OLAS13]PII97154.1 hypothetical protein BMH29_12860 [Leucobacter sp. OLDS2]PIJ00032.1 hypothetical protein BMH28_09825 [Leucobacter sp. OLCS4]